MAGPSAGESPHLLLLARYLPPAINGGIYRPTAMMRAAERRGWRVTAISQPLLKEPTAAGLELAGTIPSSVRLLNYAEPLPGDASHYFAPRLSGGHDVIEPILAAARRACQDTPPALVMASGPPFAEFVAALVLSQEWRIPLALDYRDEWTQCPFPFVGVGNADWFWERRCLKKASLVFFTTESQWVHQIRSFPQLDPTRTAVAPNGSHEDGAAPHRPAAVSPDLPTIAFLGTLGEHNDLGEFLATLDEAVALNPALAGGVRIAFVGTKPPNEREILARFPHQEVIQAIDHVPLSEAQAIMRGSAALLLFNPPRLARYIPGKAYDYMAARSRIVLYGEGGELDRLLADYPWAMRVNRQDARALMDVLSRIAGGLGPVEGTISQEFLARISRDRSAEQMVIALEKLLPSQLAISSPAVA